MLDILTEVRHRIASCWLKFRSASRVLCNCQILIRLTEIVDKTTIRPALVYSYECWIIENASRW